MKTCTICKCEKDESEFSVQKRKTKTGISQKRRSECRPCYNEYIRTYLKGNDKHKKRVKNLKVRLRDLIHELKIKTGCKICGYNKCATSLHYHHVDPSTKEFEISWAVNRQTDVAKVTDEIKKCVLLCSNCHGEVEEGITKL